MISFVTTRPEDTEKFGAALQSILPAKSLVLLYGVLGAGKTTLIRGLLRAFGYAEAVKSPTFSLVEEYRAPHFTLFHFDLYRLKNAEELINIGIEDYLREPALCFIEWPQIALSLLPEADLVIKITPESTSRIIQAEFKRPDLGVLFETLL
jgi:tRNA threonylcarbamoyladenosine biosynthesis protein TsaE